MSALRRWLESAAEHPPLAPGLQYPTRAAFVLREGRAFASAKLTHGELALVRDAADAHCRFRGAFQHQQCFTNSQMAVTHDPSALLTYVEGYALDPRTPGAFLHGWIILDEKVIDFTGPPDNPDCLAPEPPAILGELNGREYFGVPFHRRYVLSRFRATRGAGSLIDDWEHGRPLLTGTQTGWKAEHAPGMP